MSKFTTTIDNLIKSNFNLGLTQSDYPIFDEGYRNTLNQKIIDHYRFREIEGETPEMFRFYLNRTLREVMPLYNQYYKQAKIDFNAHSQDYTETYTKTVNGVLNSTGESTTESDGTAKNTNHGFQKEFETPNAPITEIDEYVTNAKQTDETLNKEYKDKTSGNSKNNSNSQSTETFSHTMQGKDGIKTSESILKFRQTFINIDMMVINSLADCFINIY